MADENHFTLLTLFTSLQKDQNSETINQIGIWLAMFRIFNCVEIFLIEN